MQPSLELLTRRLRMGKMRSILIVDDDVNTSQMTKMLLEQTGLYTVNVCNRGSVVLNLIRETRPELVLLDIVMPDVDGTEIAEQIRKDKSLDAVRVVFMTSLVSQKEVAETSVIGGHPFISKPISGEALLKRVEGFFKIGK
jgi:DNA-binding response OmpR family regulator